MNIAKIKESKFIHASPEAVYQVLADYEVGHAAILPKPYFTEMRVIEGGFGAGTVAEVDMEVFGVKRTMIMVVTEPQVGHIMVETDQENGIVTKFIFEAVDNGCLLTFDSTMQFADGILGFMEKFTTPMITRNIYRKELDLIAQYVEKSPQFA